MKLKNSHFEKMAKQDMQDLLKKEFTAKTSFWLAKLFSKLETESKIYFGQKQKLIEKYAKRDKDNKIISTSDQVSIDTPELFSKDLNDIMDIDIEIDMEKIKIDLSKEPKVSINEINLLMPFIEEL